MTENTGSVEMCSTDVDAATLCNRVYDVANVLQVASSLPATYHFASKTSATGVDTLITLKMKDNNKVNITVNCEKMVIGSMLVKDLKISLAKV